VSYNKVLVQRNRLLKELPFHPEYEDTLPVWDQQLVKYGRSLMVRREQFLTDLNGIISEIHDRLTGGREQILISYEPDCKPEELESALSASREKDMKNKMTSRGPHRDDILFLVNGVDIRRFGSQGQQRSAALSLKLSEIEMIRKSAGDTPVLLLDDVLSELDSRRQNHLLESIQNIQTIITCTGLDDFVNHNFRINKLFRVVNGSIVSEK
jgi:DNA replication and repair protein RecF